MSRFAFVLCVVFDALRVLAAPFQNLGFEAANTNTLISLPFSPGVSIVGPTQDLLPGWQVFRGTNLLPTIGYNLSDLWQPFGLTGGVTLTTFAIDGRFSLTLAKPSDFVSPGPLSILQRGDIPAEARFLAFTYTELPFIASINGIDVSLRFVGGGPASPKTFFADISEFAGQNVELAFRPSADSMGQTVGLHTLDSIAFLIPEPSSTALFILGALAFLGKWAWRSRWKRKP